MANKAYDESAIQAIADAIRAKNGLTDTYTVAQMAAAIEAIESGGGGLDWVGDYSNFAAGTFIPTEALTSYSIDTGIPYRDSKYRQELLIWSDPAARFGLIVGFMSSLATGAANSKTGFVGSYSVGYGAKMLAESDVPLPEIGETIWTITGLSSSTNFRAGKTYHWMLLEKPQ